MAGTFFEYLDGYVRVAYSRAWNGDIFIDFSLFGDAVVATPCDDKFEKGEPELNIQEDVVIRTWTSSSVSSFFTDLVRWLEAVVCGVRECAFGWDGEGPEGELRWVFDGRDNGFFVLDWSGTDRSPGRACRVRLDQTQMVRSFYASFRGFVESDRYDPLDYESLDTGETLALVLDGADPGRLADHVAMLPREQAEALLAEMLDLAYDRNAGYPRKASLAEFTQRAMQRPPDRRQGRWLSDHWDTWSQEERRRDFAENACRLPTNIGFGEKLRELRSPMVERWIAERDESSGPDSLHAVGK
ncbi:hypothetical protein [Rhodanobacter ginsenosidimutans]|uniref:Knr4/Smi1-like domain-containing protein n=1 Tax=Rhodanobacter ginsenosidimutans TaxID=490571 RepID=A0ABW0JWE5_9GAMM